MFRSVTSSIKVINFTYNKFTVTFSPDHLQFQYSTTQKSDVETRHHCHYFQITFSTKKVKMEKHTAQSSSNWVNSFLDPCVFDMHRSEKVSAARGEPKASDRNRKLMTLCVCVLLEASPLAAEMDQCLESKCLFFIIAGIPYVFSIGWKGSHHKVMDKRWTYRLEIDHAFTLFSFSSFQTIFCTSFWFLCSMWFTQRRKTEV